MNNNTSVQKPIKNNLTKTILSSNKSDTIHIALIGAGIMSTTIGTLLTILEPTWKIHMYERLHQPAQESSNAWNNAGTGHSAFCELNYTTYNASNDSINIEKAIEINESFEISRQLWTYLVCNNFLNNPESFVNNVPHMSFVWGEKNVYFLKKRFQALQKSILFTGMMYSEDPKEIYQWAPLIINGRDKLQKIAATYMEIGTDINFGEITKQLLQKLQTCPNFKLYLQHDVTHLKQYHDKTWSINILDTYHNKQRNTNADYIFIGGGGKSLNLLQTSNIPETIGYAGFPVGGQFLITNNPKIVSQHSVKTYGIAPINTPPMSVPHMDTRIFNGNKILLFGPFATFSSKFLKYGSWTDFFHSLNKDNIIPMIQAGIDNFSLIKYLISQLMMSHSNRIHALKKYYPKANASDWSLIQAGQRVQIIKKNKKNRGILQFGTEIISSNDGTLSALLGASPGASTVASITLKLLEIMFHNHFHNESWKKKLTEIIPSYTKKLNEDPILTNKIRKNISSILKLNFIEIKK